jgi:hypothetical protein
MLDRAHHKIDFDRSSQRTDVLDDRSQRGEHGVGTSIEQDMRDAWAECLAYAREMVGAAAVAPTAPDCPSREPQRLDAHSTNRSQRHA